MEEQFMFTRVHDALDIPTPPGAYERLRTELTKKPVRTFRWPALQMRTSTMGFRLAAGLVVAAIAVAAAAAALAIHNSTNNISPAGSTMSIAAYKNKMNADAMAANTTYSAPCDVGVHSGCAADAGRGIPVVQQWIDDTSGPNIPARFTVINAELHQHLVQNIAAQRDLLAASQRGDGPAMDQAFVVALYAAQWTGIVVPLIADSQQVSATGYKNIVTIIKQHALDLCLTTCTLLVSNQAKSCVTNAGSPCLPMFDDVASNFASMSGLLVRDAAPSSLSVKDASLQGDLESADSALLNIRVAIAAGDQATINSGVAQLLRISARIEQDVNDIVNG